MSIKSGTLHFLLSGAGTRLNHTNASTTFANLLDLLVADAARRPRAGFVDQPVEPVGHE